MATYKQPQPNNLPTGKNGYPQKDVKTSGIQVRGRENQTKGKTARGPMA